MLNEKERDTLIKYRFEQVNESVTEAQLLLDKGLLRGAVNRIYYAMFYSVLILALQNQFETSKHQQLLGWFNKNFIYTNKIDKRFGSIIQKAFENRNEGDYEPLVSFEKESVSQMFSEMELFLERIKEEIKKNQ